MHFATAFHNMSDRPLCGVWTHTSHLGSRGIYSPHPTCQNHSDGQLDDIHTKHLRAKTHQDFIPAFRMSREKKIWYFVNPHWTMRAFNRAEVNFLTVLGSEFFNWVVKASLGGCLMDLNFKRAQVFISFCILSVAYYIIGQVTIVWLMVRKILPP